MQLGVHLRRRNLQAPQGETDGTAVAGAELAEGSAAAAEDGTGVALVLAVGGAVATAAAGWEDDDGEDARVEEGADGAEAGLAADIAVGLAVCKEGCEWEAWRRDNCGSGCCACNAGIDWDILFCGATNNELLTPLPSCAIAMLHESIGMGVVRPWS